MEQSPKATSSPDFLSARSNIDPHGMASTTQSRIFQETITTQSDPFVQLDHSGSPIHHLVQDTQTNEQENTGQDMQSDGLELNTQDQGISAPVAGQLVQQSQVHHQAVPPLASESLQLSVAQTSISQDNQQNPIRGNLAAPSTNISQTKQQQRIQLPQTKPDVVNIGKADMPISASKRPYSPYTLVSSKYKLPKVQQADKQKQSQTPRSDVQITKEAGLSQPMFAQIHDQGSNLQTQSHATVSLSQELPAELENMESVGPAAILQTSQQAPQGPIQRNAAAQNQPMHAKRLTYPPQMAGMTSSQVAQQTRPMPAGSSKEAIGMVGAAGALFSEEGGGMVGRGFGEATAQPQTVGVSEKARGKQLVGSWMQGVDDTAHMTQDQLQQQQQQQQQQQSQQQQYQQQEPSHSQQMFQQFDNYFAAGTDSFWQFFGADLDQHNFFGLDPYNPDFNFGSDDDVRAILTSQQQIVKGSDQGSKHTQGARERSHSLFQAEKVESLFQPRGHTIQKQNSELESQLPTPVHRQMSTPGDLDYLKLDQSGGQRLLQQQQQKSFLLQSSSSTQLAGQGSILLVGHSQSLPSTDRIGQMPTADSPTPATQAPLNVAATPNVSTSPSASGHLPFVNHQSMSISQHRNSDGQIQYSYQARAPHVVYHPSSQVFPGRWQIDAREVKARGQGSEQRGEMDCTRGGVWDQETVGDGQARVPGEWQRGGLSVGEVGRHGSSSDVSRLEGRGRVARQRNPEVAKRFREKKKAQHESQIRELSQLKEQLFQLQIQNQQLSGKNELLVQKFMTQEEYTQENSTSSEGLKRSNEGAGQQSKPNITTRAREINLLGSLRLSLGPFQGQRLTFKLVKSMTGKGIVATQKSYIAHLARILNQYGNDADIPPYVNDYIKEKILEIHAFMSTLARWYPLLLSQSVVQQIQTPQQKQILSQQLYHQRLMHVLQSIKLTEEQILQISFARQLMIRRRSGFQTQKEELVHKGSQIQDKIIADAFEGIDEAVDDMQSQQLVYELQLTLVREMQNFTEFMATVIKKVIEPMQFARLVVGMYPLNVDLVHFTRVIEQLHSNQEGTFELDDFPTEGVGCGVL